MEPDNTCLEKGETSRNHQFLGFHVSFLGGCKGPVKVTGILSEAKHSLGVLQQGRHDNDNALLGSRGFGHLDVPLEVRING